MMIINFIGISLIALIIWWFWLYKPNNVVATSTDVLIEVKEGVAHSLLRYK